MTNLLITGAGGYLGRLLVARLVTRREDFGNIVALDFREEPIANRLAGVEYLQADVRDAKVIDFLKDYSIDTVVHLASIMAPGNDREFEYSVDVGGTENVLKACVEAKVGQIIVSSSGAAYGYHADNPKWLDEEDAIRGNREFSYSDHKRLIEEMLAEYRKKHSQLKQLILRPGTILGETTDNQITDLFHKKAIMGLFGTKIPFVFIWDQDVVGTIIKGIVEQKEGIFNLAGDGTLSMREIATIVNRPFVPLPVSLVKSALWLLKKFGLTQYGPEQTMYLQYRPVLSNRRLKEEFGYIPQKTSREALDFYLTAARRRGRS
jgi:UDP-glucose 4-epimerase